MSGAPARSRSVTFSSLAASSASVIACRNRRRPFSVKIARHGSPASSGGYTRIPHSSLHHHTRGIADGLAGVPPVTRPGRARRGTSCPRLGTLSRARGPVVLDLC